MSIPSPLSPLSIDPAPREFQFEAVVVAPCLPPPYDALTMIESNQIADLAARHADDAVALRRWLHAHPETAYTEHETVRYLTDRLREYGITFRDGLAGGTGIIAEIPGAEGGPTVAIRTDIDALPIAEETGLPFASQNPGTMHACGHDVHMSCVLTAARILHTVSPHLAGSVRVLFQPAEEKLPGGAPALIADGALATPRPASVIGQHINPALPTGVVGFRTGQFMASVDDLYITVNGRGGHAAHPDRVTDPVLIAARIISALQSIPSRNAPPDIPTVLSIGKVTAAGATNVIPNTVELVGTFRTVDEAWRFEAHRRIRELCGGIAAAAGASSEVRINVGFPSLFNEPALTSRLHDWAQELLGQERIVEVPLTLGGEDFAYYAAELPGCFYNLGVSAPEELKKKPGLHSSTLMVDEKAIETGAALMAWLAVRELQYRAGES